jgi:hypothetical protein
VATAGGVIPSFVRHWIKSGVVYKPLNNVSKAVLGSKQAMLEAQSKSNEALTFLQAADSKAS